MKQLGTSIHKDMTTYLRDFGFGGFLGYGSGVPSGLVNAGKMKPERVEKFRKLLEMMDRYRRKNQYE